MPSSPAKICNWCGSAYRNACKCTAKREAIGRPSAAKRGYDRHWRKLRIFIINREPICRICREQLTQEIDHIIRKADGGTDDLENLQGLCRECHSNKTARENRLKPL